MHQLRYAIFFRRLDLLPKGKLCTCTHRTGVHVYVRGDLDRDLPLPDAAQDLSGVHIHVRDYLDRNLPFRDAVRDLSRTRYNPTQEKMSCIDPADVSAPTRLHELDHTDHTDQE